MVVRIGMDRRNGSNCIAMLTIYRNTDLLATVTIDEQTTYTHVVMGEHRISTVFIVPSPIDLRTDDYIIFRGEHYEINQPPAVTKLNNFTYRYEVNFEHYIYRMYNKVFMDEGAVEFSYYGTPSEFIQLIAANMNDIDSGWSVGQVDDADPIHISFVTGAEGYTCRTALTYIAEQFRLEYWLVGKFINFTRMAGVSTNMDFEYGRGKGLYSLSRLAMDSYSYINKLYAFGGTTNIPYDYRSGDRRLVFSERYLERPLLPGEKRREGSVVFDDIFPSRTGTVSTVSGDVLSFTDTSIDFDLNGQLIDGEQAKVVFKSGELSGYEFEIASYNHSTKTIQLIKIVEQNGYELPNTTFEILTGDQYTLTGINMPSTYITAAEAKLKVKATEKLNQISRPPYEVEIDEKYIRDNGVVLNAGDRVNIKDAALGIDEEIRVTSVSFPLVNEANITAVIADLVPYSIQERTVIDQSETRRAVKVVDRAKSELARQNMLRARRLQELAFDPDGYFDMDRIRPLSIETGMLSVGAKSQNFGLNGVSIDANTGSDPNHLTISGGSLVHYEVEIEGVGYVWGVSPGDFPALDPIKVYYLSARCSTSVLVGGWHLSETPVKTEDEPGWWHFNVGILYPVDDGSRGFDFTKGMTFIVGDRITTGRIQSLDGLNFFDLSQAKFNLGGLAAGIDWDVTTPNTLTIRGAVASDVITVGSGGYVNSGISGVSEAGAQSIRMWAGDTLANRAAAPFRVQQDGAMSSSKGNIGGFVIDSTTLRSAIVDPGSGTTSPSSGIILSDLGVLSRNAGMSFLPATTGFDFSGSLVGETSDPLGTPSSLFPANVRAGVIGVRRQELTEDAINQLINSYGNYGLMASSIKLIGAMYQPVRFDDGSTNTTMTATDYLLIKGGTNANVLLPAGPEHGREVIIKNGRDVDITVNGNSKNIVDEGNSTVTSLTLASGEIIRLMFYGNSQWMIIGRLRKGLTDDITYVNNVIGGTPTFGVIRVRNGIITSSS